MRDNRRVEKKGNREEEKEEARLKLAPKFKPILETFELILAYCNARSICEGWKRNLILDVIE